MSFVFDIILLIIIVGTILKCVSKGFVKSIMSLVSIVGAFFAANFLYTPLATWLKDEVFSEKIVEWLAGVIKSMIGTIGLDEIFKDKPLPFVELLARFGTDLSTIEGNFTNVSVATDDVLTKMAQMIADPIITGASNVLAFMLIFIVALVIFKIITVSLDAIFRLPLLNSANKILGLILGVLCAAFYAWLFSILSNGIIQVTSAINPEIFGNDTISNSILLKFFLDFNPLETFELMKPLF